MISVFYIHRVEVMLYIVLMRLREKLFLPSVIMELLIFMMG